MSWKQFWGMCEHKLVTLDKIPRYDVTHGKVSELPRFHTFILECEKCGDIKKVKT